MFNVDKYTSNVDLGEAHLNLTYTRNPISRVPRMTRAVK